MNHDHPLAFVRRHHRGVLATFKRDGRPQLSNVGYLLDDDGLSRSPSPRIAPKSTTSAATPATP